MARPGYTSFPGGRKLKILTALLILLAALVGIQTSCLSSFGALPEGARLERMRKSPRYNGKIFENPVMSESLKPMEFWDQIKQQFFGKEQRIPPGPLPVVFPDPASFPAKPAPGLRAIWFGHSAVLIEIDGVRVFTDPIFAKRASPFASVGPTRFHKSPVPLEKLPSIDAVVISHDHYDHLDQMTAVYLTQRGTTYYVPLGIGAHLEAWGVSEDRIVEMDWGESKKIGAVTIHCTPAVHYSGRGLTNRNSTLWSSWSVVGPDNRFFYSGDTGVSGHFETIGAEFGPFDLTVIKVGSYDDTWNNIHMLPEEAVEAHLAVRGRRMLGTHWATFNMAYHAWDEPIKRTIAACAEKNVELVTPRLGETVEVGGPFQNENWWEAVEARKAD